MPVSDVFIIIKVSSIILVQVPGIGKLRAVRIIHNIKIGSIPVMLRESGMGYFSIPEIAVQTNLSYQFQVRDYLQGSFDIG